ncbi:hypothetical protein HZC30_04880 [Candidatus Woesearchaeota archaeon]|nr:hypothetical protein [Candidatus Woesearchaeota archaeon]
MSDGIDSKTEYVAFIVQAEEVTPTNTAPVMNDVAPQTVTEGGQLTFSVDAVDVDGDKLTFQAKKAEPDCKNSWCKAFDAIEDTVETFFGYYLPDYVDFNENTGVFTLSPGFDVIKHPDTSKTVKFEVRASDGKKYSAWEKVEVTITDKNQIPTLTYYGEISQEGKKVYLIVTASDKDSEDKLEIKALGLPEWVTSTQNGNMLLIEGMSGCADAGDYSFTAEVGDGIANVSETFAFTVLEACKVDVPGCTDEKAANYNPDATVDDGSCTYPPADVLGCTNSNATNYNPKANVDDGSCVYPPGEIPGCMDSEATNYNSLATVDDGSCTFPPPADVLGCTDAKATNYNPSATKDDGSCTFAPPVVVFGCTDKNALNYYIQATTDNGGCKYPQPSKNVYFQKVHLVSDAVSAGDAAFFSVTVANNGDVDLEDLKVTAVVYELGAKKSTGQFNLDSGDSKNLNLVLPIPYDAEAGDYLVKVTVGNDDFHDTAFREISVVEGSW